MAAPKPASPDIYSIVDGDLRLTLHPGQLRAWDSKRRFVIVLAGTQGGKTSFGPWWLYQEMMLRGAGDYLAITSTFDLFKLKMLPMLRDCFEHKLGIGRYWAGDRVMEIRDPVSGEFLAKTSSDRMWARIILRSAEAGGGLEASTAKGAWLDEAGQDSFQVTTWEAILRRLSLAQGRALLTTTVYNLGWLKTSLYDKWVGKHPDIDVIQFDSTENPNFPQEEMERARADMPLWRFNMLYRGRFERPAGMIYDCFDDTLNTCPRFAIPDEWIRYSGLDFGGINTVMVYLAEEPISRKLYLYREYHAGNRTAVEHTHHMLRGEPGIPTCVGGSKSEGQWRKEFRSGGRLGEVKVSGLPVREPRISDVELGIQCVYGCLKRRDLVVFQDCERALADLKNYAREVDDNGDPTEDIDNKASFHFCDALRYILGYIRNARAMPVPPPTEEEIQAKKKADAEALEQKQREHLSPSNVNNPFLWR